MDVALLRPFTAAYRERIGDMIPPAAAKEMAKVIGEAFLLAKSGETFMLSAQPVWVRPAGSRAHAGRWLRPVSELARSVSGASSQTLGFKGRAVAIARACQRAQNGVTLVTSSPESYGYSFAALIGPASGTSCH